MDKHDLELALGLFYFLSYYFFFFKAESRSGKGKLLLHCSTAPLPNRMNSWKAK